MNVLLGYINRMAPYAILADEEDYTHMVGVQC